MRELDPTNLETILNALDALVYVTDMDTHELLFMNSYAEKHWGQAWIGKRCWQVLRTGQSGPCAFCNDQALRDTSRSTALLPAWEFQNAQTGRWFECRVRAVPWIDGRVARVQIGFDITERKTQERDLRRSCEEAEHRARIDVLTQLKNRGAFFQDAERILHDPTRASGTHCMAMLDVDRFKQINDVHGHFVGDGVLREIGHRITRGLRKTDIGSRLGGDEFALMFPNTEIHVAKSICEAIRSSISAVEFETSEQPLQVSCSVGLVIQRAGSGTVDGALMLADKALYQAKKLGRNRIATLFGNDNMLTPSKQWTDRIHRAVRRARAGGIFAKRSRPGSAKP